MTAAEARAAAAAEGLELLRAEKNASGFKYVVSSISSSSSTYFVANVKSEYLGVFATAEEAALAVARYRDSSGARGGGLVESNFDLELALLKDFQKREAPTRQQVVSERALAREKQMLRDWERGLRVTNGGLPAPPASRRTRTCTSSCGGGCGTCASR